MEINKPIKRHINLQFISREHHHSLLLSWKIRVGLTKGVEVSRIKCYADWFYNNHIKPHFILEEKFIFPILGNQNELVKKAITDHKRLTRLFVSSSDLKKSLSQIEEELEQHIRFEERVLFNEIQKKATDQELQFIASIHTEEKFKENTDDEFWN